MSDGRVTVGGFGYEVRFSRRKYGTRTFTWGQVLIGGRWFDLGDPWPAVFPRRSEVERAVSFILQGRGADALVRAGR